MPKVSLQKNDQQAISQFTGDVIEVIEELRTILIDIFNGYYNKNCGNFPQYVINFLFDEWLTKNLNANMIEVTKLIRDNYNENDYSKLEKKLREIFSGFSNNDEIVTEILVNKRKGILLDNYIDKILYKTFKFKIDIYIDQTSIQFVGRYLMLFVGIDKKAWAQISIPTNISNIFLRYYWIIRNEMYKIIPSIYNFNELDWIYISDTDKQSLNVDEIRILESYESQLDKYLGRVYTKLNKYDYSNVDSDIWKIVYQKILPKNETNKLGFVHTPDEIVDVILDVVNYKEENENLCKLKLLDPACGSGTFLVNALTRLINHLEKDMPCHVIQKGIPEWKKEEIKLNIILENFCAIDINPFATFLTTLNLTFMLMDSFSQVHSKNPYYQLNFKILTNDSLGAEYGITEFEQFTNSRKSEAIINMKKFTQLLKEKFDIIIGNPPWGIVLKGKLGPLGNDEKRKEYKDRFESATGKYDIYVLFMERGINLLKNNGYMGLITQVMYVSQDYGKGIKKIIREQGSIETFIDLSTLGGFLFPNFTNYPAITVFKKGQKQGKIKLMKVTLK